jgi:SAM-dependent methyltransferase
VSPPDRRPACPSGCGCAANEFGADQAERDLRTYRRSGPDRTTRWLIDGLRGQGAGGRGPAASDDLAGRTVLDIGAGIGAVHLALLEAGAASAVDVDGSPAYVEAARSEATRVGLVDRVRYEIGDYVELAAGLEGFDLVALDRVICCYPDMQSLVGLSAAGARARYGLVYPRDTWWIRAGSAVFNAALRLFRQQLRFWVHRTADVEEIVAGAGLTRRFDRRGLFWQVVVFERRSGVTGTSAGS